MISTIFNKTTVISFGIGAMSVGLPLILLLKRQLQSADNEYEDFLNIEEAMFFSDEGTTCREHFKNGKDGLKSSQSCSSPNCPFKNLRLVRYFLRPILNKRSLGYLDSSCTLDWCTRSKRWPGHWNMLLFVELIKS